MQLKHSFWYFTSVLSSKFCDELIQYGNSLREQEALIGDITSKQEAGKEITKEDIDNLKRKRDSNISWIAEPWLYREIHPYVELANKNAEWNFQWDFSEACQFTKYKLNQYYDWHQDGWNEPYDRPTAPDFHGKIRKLSVTVSLSDQNDYEGGELEFDFRNRDDGKEDRRACKEILPKGSICVFPSFIWHRVTPVTKGIRYSLVMWSLGYPFK